MSGGLIGVVTKPVTGMLDLVSQTSQGPFIVQFANVPSLGLAGSSRNDSKGRQRGENPRSVPITELGLWFSPLKFETLAQRLLAHQITRQTLKTLNRPRYPDNSF